MRATLLYPRELIAERVVLTPADQAQIALCRGPTTPGLGVSDRLCTTHRPLSEPAIPGTAPLQHYLDERRPGLGQSSL
jgi:hypothetical protein